MALNYLFLLVLVANFVYILCTENGRTGDLESRFEALEQKCDAQNNQLNSKLVQLEDIVQKQNKHVAKLDREMNVLRQFASQKLQQIGQRSDKRFVLDEEGTVAFHATLTGGRALDHLHVNQTIIFDTVMLNIGGNYHSQQGLFVATTPGIYIFSVSIMAVYGGKDSTMVFILKNGNEIAAAIADGRNGNHDQGSTTIVTQLVPGDEVWVSVQRHEDTALWADGLDSFMGCLITQI